MADTNIGQLAVVFQSLGFQEAKVAEIVKNKKLAAALGQIANEVNSGPIQPLDKTIIALLHSLASLSKDINDDLRPYRKLVSEAIVDGRLKSNVQLDAAYKYILVNGAESTKEGLNEASGVGIEITREQVEKAVEQYIADNKAEIEQNRYKGVPSIIVGVKNLKELRWASPAMFKPAIDAQVLALLGPKDERDLVKKKEKKPAAAKKDSGAAKDSTTTSTSTSVRSMYSEGFLGALHKAGGNQQIKPELMAAHLKATGGRVFTRFPPEPNGYLHIGHSKAIAVNFGYASYHKGECYLRYDDTNPEAEEEQYFTSIKDIVEWLGFQPYKITYSSDYFDQLYELAETMIKKDLAYVCHCTAEQVKAARGVTEDGTRGGDRTPCEHRDRTIEDNLQEFRNMRDGKFQPGEATLRMKQDLLNPNPQMWDLVAYRVLNATHHRTGDKWKIYPTYDFTHCLVDSIENISHSLCTTEFYLSRESYEWLCDAVEVYKPAQREYGRLNITGTVLSKRKIAKLVNKGIVRGWDDPRLFTLVGIKRRGVPPGAILSFVAQLGVTTSNTNIQVARFENSVRKYLEDSTPRLMMVQDPVVVILDNLPVDHLEEFSVPFKPGSPEMGEHTLPFTNRLYVDRSDFREEASKDYFRLAPGQSVGLLKVPHNIRVTSFTKDPETGLVTEIHAHYENDVPFKKPKTYIQWIADAPAQGSPVYIDELRIFNQLFNSENPAGHPNFLEDINPESEVVIKSAIIERGIHEVREKSPWVVPGKEESSGKEKKGSLEAVRFQALRVGYFCMDKDTTDDKIVLNRIVSLKEDTAKNI
ncbi:glutaminyl-tRNA synthetase [Nadsonia fulvescens var. elongata DSM 6958]|uniref:glutamine--tRNA ligase n=1 Tax=Nadsonia fulvescens var. elongata DSM 6958 TaxID=857566 RepID=A0A1E3PCB0_9ASCO|nr:glutaminyl-tRNA synthetase [Nadsonia fulvescens var. elongata DSM 6958]